MRKRARLRSGRKNEPPIWSSRRSNPDSEVLIPPVSPRSVSLDLQTRYLTRKHYREDLLGKAISTILATTPIKREELFIQTKSVIRIRIYTAADAQIYKHRWSRYIPATALCPKVLDLGTSDFVLPPIPPEPPSRVYRFSNPTFTITNKRGKENFPAYVTADKYIENTRGIPNIGRLCQSRASP